MKRKTEQEEKKKDKNENREKRNKTAGPRRGPAGLTHYGRNYKPTRQAAKKTKGGPKKYKAHHHTKPSF